MELAKTSEHTVQEGSEGGSQTGSSANSDQGRSRKRRFASYCLIRL